MWTHVRSKKRASGVRGGRCTALRVMCAREGADPEAGWSPPGRPQNEMESQVSAAADGNSGSQKRPSRRNSQFAVEFLLGHPTASNEEVVKRTGCSPRSVTRARAFLVATGQLQRSWYDRAPHETGPGQEGTADEAPAPPQGDLPLFGPRMPLDLEKALRADNGLPLSNEQMKQRYSAIARYAQKSGEFTLEITAMQALARLEAATGAKNRLGPAPPHTREERRDRVQAILEAAGPSIVAEAVVLAFKNDELTGFLNTLGQQMAGKVENGVIIAENRPTEDQGRAEGGEIPHQTPLPASEVGVGDADDRAEAGSTAPDAGGNADNGGTSGSEGG